MKLRSHTRIAICCLVTVLNITQISSSNANALQSDVTYFNATSLDKKSDNVINKGFWQPSTNAISNQMLAKNINSQSKTGLYFDVDIALLEQQLLNNNKAIITLPLPDGSYVDFQLTLSQVMHPELAAKYPSIKTFTGYQLEHPENIGNFDITPHGFHGVFNIGDEKVFIDPSSRTSASRYHNYYLRDAKPIEHSTLAKRLPPLKRTAEHNDKISRKTRNNRTTPALTTYKLAMATTGEYAQYHGGTKEAALAALATLVNRLNDVYQRDLSIAFQLVADNDSIIYLNSATDPYDNTDEDIDVNTDIINDAIGINNYDIGHVVTTGAGGIAGLGVVCSNAKGQGVTGSDRPTGDAFYIDFVAHEIGHQFGAEHTFNGAQGNCEGNRDEDEPGSAYEPGSGSTIMGYAGICEGQNLQNHSDPYFHNHSIDQIRDYTTGITTCGTTTSLTNSAPTVDAGSDYTIPAKTSFTLIGSATDTDNDDLTYSWEQYDLGSQSNNADEDAIDDGLRPLFRTFNPTSSAQRTLPKLDDILNNRSTYGEALPTTNRDLNFRLVVRDNQNNLVYDAMKVRVSEVSESFSVNNIAIWRTSEQTVNWHTADTEHPPVSCDAVDILLSTDSGASFPQTLASNTDNDGSQTISAPNVITSNARIKIVCRDNIFFAINDADFIINVSDAAPAKPVYIGQTSISTNEDSSMNINTSMLKFQNDQPIDSLQILDGDNYTFNNLTIMPTANFYGTILVNMTATTDDLVSDIFQVTITINSVNDQPVAIADTATVTQGSINNLIDVTTNDSDIDGETITLISATTNGSGSVEVVNNNISYTSASGFTGTEVISYTIEDSEQARASGELSITVNPIATLPVVPNDSSSGGGSVYYLLIALVIALARKTIKGQRNV